MCHIVCQACFIPPQVQPATPSPKKIEPDCSPENLLMADARDQLRHCRNHAASLEDALVRHYPDPIVAEVEKAQKELRRAINARDAAEQALATEVVMARRYAASLECDAEDLNLAASREQNDLSKLMILSCQKGAVLERAKWLHNQVREVIDKVKKMKQDIVWPGQSVTYCWDHSSQQDCEIGSGATDSQSGEQSTSLLPASLMSSTMKAEIGIGEEQQVCNFTATKPGQNLIQLKDLLQSAAQEAARATQNLSVEKERLDKGKAALLGEEASGKEAADLAKKLEEKLISKVCWS